MTFTRRYILQAVMIMGCSHGLACSLAAEAQSAPGSQRGGKRRGQGGQGPVVPAIVGHGADGSVGQRYSAPVGMESVTWLRQSLGRPYRRVPVGERGGADYVAQPADLGFRLVAKGLLDGKRVEAVSLAVVLPAPLVFDPLTETARAKGMGLRPMSGSVRMSGGRTMALNAGTQDGAVNFAYARTTRPYAPADLGTVAVYYRRADSAPIKGERLSLLAGKTRGGVFFDHEKLQLSGGRWLAADVSEMKTMLSAEAAPIEMQVGFNKDVGAPAEAFFSAGLARAQGRPTVLLSFDDGWMTIRLTAHPEMQARGMRFTLYPAPRRLGGGTGDSAFMSPADIRYLYEQGHDIGCDGTPDDKAVSSDPRQAVANMEWVRNWVETHVGDRASRFACWPFGNPQSDAVAQAVLDAGFHLVRGTQLPAISHTRFGIGLADRKKLPSQGVGALTDPAHIIALIDQAILRGGTVSLHMHSFTESKGGNIFIPARVYTPILDHIAMARDKGLLDVLTMSEFWARDGGNSVPAG